MVRDRLKGAKQRHVRNPASARAFSALAATQSFYRDVLGGRQLWPTAHDSAGDSLWFFIAGTLVKVAPAREDMAETIELSVDSPTSIAERCWDSGYTVSLPADGR